MPFYISKKEGKIMLFKYNNISEIYNMLEKLNAYSQEMSKEQNSISKMKEIYEFVKENLSVFYNDGELSYYYGKVITKIMGCEEQLSKTFITESDPKFNFEDEDNINNLLSVDNLMNRIVLKTRKELLKKHFCKNPNEEIKKQSFTNDCYKSSEIVKKICDDNGIKSYRIEIYPGFSSKNNLCNGNGFHYFNIVKLYDKYYLIDCTYRQFFKLKGNFIEKIGLINMQGCLPGTFILMDKERKEVAKKILKYGWVELDENVLKAYLDAFAISYRNGIYYEKTNDYSFKTSYSIDDYVKFLNGEDNQINHEGKESLGYQKRPAKMSKKIQ